MIISPFDCSELKRETPRGFLSSTLRVGGLDGMPVRPGLINLMVSPYGFMGSPFFLVLY